MSEAGRRFEEFQSTIIQRNEELWDLKVTALHIKLKCVVTIFAYLFSEIQDRGRR